MASACLEVWQPSGRVIMTLSDERVTVGKAPTNSVVFTHDLTVSRRHAVLENLGLCWTVRDLGSRNGTYVNGRRITGECALNHRDELRVGNCRLVYLDESLADEPGYMTLGSDPSPELTARERDVVAALCRPLFAGDPFPQPASTRQIALALHITDGAVKQHLSHLYDKFGILTDEEQRRIALAREAIRRGAVDIAELRSTT